MPITTILVGNIPTVVVRPVDRKDLLRFLRNGNVYLIGDLPESAEVTHRDATREESLLWHSARELHRIWGGDEDQFFGIPLSPSTDRS